MRNHYRAFGNCMRSAATWTLLTPWGIASGLCWPLRVQRIGDLSVLMRNIRANIQDNIGGSRGLGAIQGQFYQETPSPSLRPAVAVIAFSAIPPPPKACT